MAYLVGYKSMPQYGIIPYCDVSGDVEIGVESPRAVHSDCEVWMKFQGDVEMVEFPVKNETLVQDLGRLVSKQRGYIQNLCSVFQ